MKRLLPGLLVLVLLAASAGATVIDDVVVGNSAFGLVQLDPSLGLRGKLIIDSTTRTQGTPDGNFVTVDTVQNLNIWSGTDCSWVNGIATVAGVTSLAVDKNTGRIAVGTSGGTVKIYNSSLAEVGSQSGFGGAIKDITFQNDGDVALCTSTGVWLLNSAFTTTLKTQSGFSSLTSLATQSGDQILIGDSALLGGKVWQFSSDLINILGSEQGYGAISDIAVQSDDSFLVATASKIYRRTSGFAASGLTSGFSNLTSLAVQSGDQVVVGDSGTGKVYLYTDDLTGFVAPAQGGFGTINQLGVLVPEPATLGVLACGGILLGLRKKK